MHPDVAALLAVQEDDIRIDELESRLAQLEPRLAAMAREHERAVAAVEKSRKALEAEERRQREMQDRLQQHRQLEQRNQSQLRSITNAREATAATAQLDQSRRMITDAEHELSGVSHRVTELRHEVADNERVVHDLEAEQATARSSLDADRAELQSQVDVLRADRDRKATAVPRSLLAKYDRIRSRHRSHALFALRGPSCGHCDTAVPLQRRQAMLRTGATEVCEGCGMLLYAPE